MRRLSAPHRYSPRRGGQQSDTADEVPLEPSLAQ
jgi:hypothetical protein